MTRTTTDGLQYSRSPGGQELQEGQISQLFVADIESGQLTLILECDQLIESPN